MIEKATIRCTPDETLDAVYRTPGAELESTFTWVEGVNRVEAVVERSWGTLVREKGFTVELRLVDVEPGECSGPEQVVLASLYNDKGSRVQGIAVDPGEWPDSWALLAADGTPAVKVKSLWSSLGSWRWALLALAVVGGIYAARKGKLL